MLSPDRAKERYNDRIMEHFQRAMRIANERGWTEPTIECGDADDGITWSFFAYYKDKPIDINLILIEQIYEDGIGHGLTWNFVVYVDGKTIINVTPYNYSDSLWANTLYELAIRFDMAIETEVDFIAIEERIDKNIQEAHQMALTLD